MPYHKIITVNSYADIIDAIYGRRTSFPDIEKVIFNGPATIVMWSDKTKTVVKCQPGDDYSPQTGLLMCVFKKAFGAHNSIDEMIADICDCKED